MDELNLRLGYDAERKRVLYYSCIFSFIWGLIAHISFFLSNALSHDSLNAIVSWYGEESTRIYVGRFFSVIFRNIFRDGITVPWLIGLYGLSFIAISVYLVSRIFEINTRNKIFFVSGIMATNLTVIALIATYVHDFDYDMLALLFAVIAVYLWDKKKNGFVLGSVFILFLLGLYQAYIATAITLVVMRVIISLLDGKELREQIQKTVKAILMVLTGGGLYFIALKITEIIFGSNSNLGAGSGISVTFSIKSLCKGILYAYGKFVQILANGKASFGTYHELTLFGGIKTQYSIAMIIINVVLIILTLISFICIVKRNRIRKGSLVFIVFLILAMPIAMNCIFVISGGSGHQLMQYADYLIYIFELFIIWKSDILNTCSKHKIEKKLF